MLTGVVESFLPNATSISQNASYPPSSKISELWFIYLTLYIHNLFYNNTIQYNTVQFMIVLVMFPFGQGDSH